MPNSNDEDDGVEVSLKESSNEDDEDVEMLGDEPYLKMPLVGPSTFRTSVHGIDLLIEAILLVPSGTF